jgi:TatD DNase family protein
VDDRHARAAVPARRPGGRGLSRRRAPDRLARIVDSHAHLQHGRFDADRDAVIERAVAAGIARMLVPGWDLPSSEAAVALAARHRGLVDAAVGVHPHDAAAATERDWQELERLAAEPGVVAIGEIGLDFFRNLSPPDVQRNAFARQLALAADRDLPVLVHDRDAHEAVTDALERWAGRPGAAVRGVLHAFSGDEAMADRLSAAGYAISVAFPVGFRSAAGPRAAVPHVPDHLLLVETDAPYLGPDRDGRNEPTTVLRVAAEVARLRGVEPEQVAQAVHRTYASLVDSA